MPTIAGIQKLQDDEYFLPYHYFLKRSDIPHGLSYHTCIDYLVDFLLANSSNNARVLDIGCGDAFLCYQLSKYSQFQIFGLDYSMKALSFARLLNQNTCFICGDAAEIKLKNKFEFIVMHEVLEHVPNDRMYCLLDNVSNHLMHDGYLIITVPSCNLPLINKHYRHYCCNILNSILTSHFTVIKIIGLHKKSKLLLRFRQIISNRFYTAKSDKLNRIYKRLFISSWKCDPNEAYTLMAICRSKLKVGADTVVLNL